MRLPQKSTFRIGCSNGKKVKLDFLIHVAREEILSYKTVLDGSTLLLRTGKCRDKSFRMSK